MGAGFSGAQDLLPHDMDEQTALSHVAADSADAAAGDMLLNGTPEEVIEQAAQWRDCGVRYMVLMNCERLCSGACVRGWRRCRPFNKIIRGLKKL